MNVTGLYPYLSQFVNNRRLQLIDEKILYRTGYMSILLEDVYQSKNISAVLRTAECLGIQNIHIVENKNRFEYNPYVTRGADKWLNIHRYNTEKENSIEAVRKIKNAGYRLVVTSPNIQGSTPEDFDITKGKFIIAFGTEWEGISKVLLDEADEYLRIPMVGYTESLNLSVSAAIIMYTLTNRIRSSPLPWRMNDMETEEVKLRWIKTMVRKADLLVENYLKQNSSHNSEM